MSAGPAVTYGFGSMVMIEADPHLSLQRSAALPWVDMRRANRSSACYQTHSHDEFSFGVIDSGHARYLNHGRQHRIGPGMTVWIDPGVAHACNPALGAWSYRMLFIEAGWMGRLQEELPGLPRQDYTPFAAPHGDDPRAWAQFNALYTSLSEPGAALAAESQLIAYLAAHGFAGLDAAQPMRPADPALRQAHARIMDQLAEPLSLGELAAVAGLSRYQLIRGFKHAYGQTPHAYQLDQRINRAKRLLKRGERIADVAQQLGFADQSHFQRHFKQRLATTPWHYQQCLRRA